LFGIGGAGGAGFLIGSGEIDPGSVLDAESNDGGGDVTGDSDRDDSESEPRAAWTATVEQRRERSMVFDTVSFATQQAERSFSKSDSPLVERLEVRPTNINGDVFRLTARPGRVVTLRQFLRSTLDISDKITRQITLANTKVQLTGSKTAVGDIIALTGTSDVNDLVVLVRAASRKELETVLNDI
jgi:hypothetical protein